MTLTTYPARGTRVRDDDGHHGRVTGNGGRMAGVPIVLVWWDGRPHEDLVSLYALEIDDERERA